jgi:hypothetical protein
MYENFRGNNNISTISEREVFRIATDVRDSNPSQDNDSPKFSKQNSTVSPSTQTPKQFS